MKLAKSTATGVAPQTERSHSPPVQAGSEWAREWESLSHYGVEQVRQVAQERGYSWDAMSESERESWINAVVFEDS